MQGEAAANASSLAQGQDVVVNALKQRFNEASGVNVDQEMANLISAADRLWRQRAGDVGGAGT